MIKRLKIYLRGAILNGTVCLMFPVVLLAASDINVYQGDASKRLNVEIAQEGVNRISFEKDRIIKVVGNEEEYLIEGEMSKGFIFLSSKLIEGEIAPVTIITEKGLTQDIDLVVVKDEHPRSILIKMPFVPERDRQKIDIRYGVKRGVIGALKQLVVGDTRNFSYRSINLNAIDPTKENRVYKGHHALRSGGAKISKISEYTDKSYKIYKYEYSEKPSDLDFDEIKKMFYGGLAVSERGNQIFVVYKESWR